MNPNTKILSSSHHDQTQSENCFSPCHDQMPSKNISARPDHLPSNFSDAPCSNQNQSQENAPDSFLSRSICSATDCTGLIPALPDSEAELDAYEEMYQFCMENPQNSK